MGTSNSKPRCAHYDSDLGNQGICQVCANSKENAGRKVKYCIQCGEEKRAPHRIHSHLTTCCGQKKNLQVAYADHHCLCISCRMPLTTTSKYDSIPQQCGKCQVRDSTCEYCNQVGVRQISHPCTCPVCKGTPERIPGGIPVGMSDRIGRFVVVQHIEQKITNSSSSSEASAADKLVGKRIACDVCRLEASFETCPVCRSSGPPGSLHSCNCSGSDCESNGKVMRPFQLHVDLRLCKECVVGREKRQQEFILDIESKTNAERKQQSMQAQTITLHMETIKRKHELMMLEQENAREQESKQATARQQRALETLEHERREKELQAKILAERQARVAIVLEGDPIEQKRRRDLQYAKELAALEKEKVRIAEESKARTIQLQLQADLQVQGRRQADAEQIEYKRATNALRLEREQEAAANKRAKEHESAANQREWSREWHEDHPGYY